MEANIPFIAIDTFGLSAADGGWLMGINGIVVTSGTEAMGEVTVQLEDGGRKVVGRGASTDVIEASAKAYIDGLNKLATVHPAAAAAS